MNTHNTYDEMANQYIKIVASRNEQDFTDSPLELAFFDTIGNVHGLTVLDAGCGEGFVSRVLTTRGATVTGIDISAPLLEAATKQNARFFSLISYIAPANSGNAPGAFYRISSVPCTRNKHTRGNYATQNRLRV